MRSEKPDDDCRHENEPLDRATAALREASDSRPAPQAVVDATVAQLCMLAVSDPGETRKPRLGRFAVRRIVRVAAAIAVVAGLLLWVTSWPSQTSALAQAARNVQTAKSVVFDLRAKSGKQQEQVSRVKILGDVIRQEEPTKRRIFFINHRTGETLNSSTLGWAVSGLVPDWKPLNGDPITQLLGLLESATQRLPDETVKGVACLVFQGHDTSPLGIAGPGELKLWLDAKTKLPSRIEAGWPNRAWDPQAYVILENFKWNVDLEPSEFDMQTLLGEHHSPTEFDVGTPQLRKMQPPTPNVASDHGKPKLVTASGDGDIKDFLDKLRLEVRVNPPAFAGSPTESRDQSGLRLIGLAIHRYLDRHQQRLVPATVIGPDGKTPHSWRVEILPFLGKGGEALYKEYRLDEPWDSPTNKRVLAQMPDIFRSAGDDLRSTNASFFALVGPGTVCEGRDGIKINQIFDGTSTTILLVEAKRGIPWTKPEDIPYDAAKPLPPLGGFDGDKFLALFADCVTVRRLSMTLGERTLKGLIGRNDRTVIDLDTLGR
jgi:Protein of unknown function (DUF1559)